MIAERGDSLNVFPGFPRDNWCAPREACERILGYLVELDPHAVELIVDGGLRFVGDVYAD